MTIGCSNGALFPPEVMKLVVPEKAAQLTAILTDLGITFRVDEDEERILFQADSQNKVIVVGTKCLARLWVHAFASFSIFYDLVALKTRDPEATRLDLRSSDRLRKAAALLKWAVKADLQVKQSEQIGVHSELLSLPPDLAVVFSDKDLAQDKHVANDHALIALGFVLYHELAHIRLGHTAQQGVLSVEQEKEADRSAAEWLLDSPGLAPTVTLARQFGIAIALGWRASLNIYVAHSEDSTHPPAWDRLYQVFEQHIEDDHALVWLFITAILNVHLVNQRRSYIDPERVFGSFKESVNYYIDVISQIGN
jgi:hypothetical protein